MRQMLRVSILFSLGQSLAIVLVTGVVLALSWSNTALAEALTMAKRAPLFTDRAPLFAAPNAAAIIAPNAGSAAPAGGKAHNGSLFAGQGAGSLLAPYPARPIRTQQRPAATAARFSLPTANMTPLTRLRHLIASAEAGSKGYDAIQHAAKRLPSKAPTQLTVQEIYTWIANTPGQNHAIGRYQFIPATLKRLVKKSGTSSNAIFDARLQDQLADILLEEAGVHDMMRGKLGRKKFMHNLAKIWAGLPTSSGQSYYKGVAGNKATMSWAYFDREMKRIFPG